MSKETCNCCNGSGLLTTVSSCMNCNGTGQFNVPEILCDCNAEEKWSEMFDRYIDTDLRTWKYIETDTPCTKCGMWRWIKVPAYDPLYEDLNEGDNSDV